MMAPELHPDDLLDREARGDLTFEEDARLAEHLVACSVCRFERQVRGDFREEFEAARPRARVTPQPPEVMPEPDAPRVVHTLRPKRASRSRVRIFMLVAAALLVASVAAAEWSTLNRDAPPRASATMPSAAQWVSIEAAARVRSSSHVPAALASVAPSTPETATPIATPTGAPRAETTRAGAPETRSLATAHAPPAPAPQPPTPPVTAAALFGEAGEARQHAAYDEALRLYGDLAQQYPQSPEAATAHAILGRLLLDRGDASGALFHFDQYLRAGGGALREEALLGRAVALQRMGVGGAEATAWHALLDACPQSVHAARARARLAALGDR